jgi:hypothetical protein
VVRATCAGLVALVVAAPVQAATVMAFYDQTGDGIGETWVMDDNGDGSADRIIYDPDQDGVLDVELYGNAFGTTAYLLVDTGGAQTYDLALVPYYSNNGGGAQVASLMWRDFDENGRYENAYYDGQLDGYYEWTMVDATGDGTADTWYASTAPRGYTAVDELARNVARIESVNILRQAGIPVFFPVGTIPLGG